VFAFLSVKANSKEICEEISFPSFFRKMLMSAFLLRFKANYLEKMHGYPSFSSGIPVALAKIYFFCVVLTWCKNLCIYNVVDTVFKCYITLFYPVVKMLLSDKLLENKTLHTQSDFKQYSNFRS